MDLFGNNDPKKKKELSFKEKMEAELSKKVEKVSLDSIWVKFFPIVMSLELEHSPSKELREKAWWYEKYTRFFSRNLDVPSNDPGEIYFRGQARKYFDEIFKRIIEYLNK